MLSKLYRAAFSALFISGALTGAASAAEMLVVPPGAPPLVTVPMIAPQDWEYYPRKLSIFAEEGLVVSFPVEFGSLVCQPGMNRTLFKIETLDGAPTIPPDDPRGLTRLALKYDADEGVLSLQVTIQPIVDGKRLKSSSFYAFKILDRFFAPRAFCQKSSAASAYRFNLYLSSSSMVIEAVPLMGGLAPVYLSPVNVGLGDFLWSATTESSGQVRMSGISSQYLNDVVTVANSRVSFYGVNWTSQGEHGHPFPRGLYNVKDSLNYQFGAKAYPTASPTLTLPRAAAALLTTP